MIRPGAGQRQLSFVVKRVVSIEEFDQVCRRFGQLHVAAPAQLGGDVGRHVARPALGRIKTHDMVGTAVLAVKRSEMTVSRSVAS
jgi:hypothetical protein